MIVESRIKDLEDKITMLQVNFVKKPNNKQLINDFKSKSWTLALKIYLQY